MFGRCKEFWITDRVLQGLVERFDVGIVVAATRPGITAGDSKTVQEHGKGNPTHWPAVIGMHYHGDDTKVAHDPFEKLFGMLIGFDILDGPPDDDTVKQIDDCVGVFEDTHNIRLKPRDVPAPDLVRSGNLKMHGLYGRDRFLRGLAMLEGLPFVEDPVER